MRNSFLFVVIICAISYSCSSRKLAKTSAQQNESIRKDINAKNDISITENDLRKKNVSLVINKAITYIDVSYKYGGESYYGIDCSGLIRKSLQAVGLYMYRDLTSSDFFNEEGEIIYSLKMLHRGDLVFFVENGGRMNHLALVINIHPDIIIIHSTLKGVRYTNLTNNYYWRSKFLQGKRIL